MKPFTFEFHGTLPFRHVDLDVVATIQYMPNDYLDVTELFVNSTRRGCLVKASDRLLVAFQNANWDYLEKYCQGELTNMVEYYRMLRQENKLCA